MIDWLTLSIDLGDLSPETVDVMRKKNGLLMAISPDGEIEWQQPMRRSVRSDSHQITVECAGALRIYGSPARLMSNRADNVFGSDCLRSNAQAMINFVSRVDQVSLPDFFNWSCSRIDITNNYDLGSLSNVRQALDILSQAQGGRYAVGNDAGTLYWSKRSTTKSGKAYSKGKHLRYYNRRHNLQMSESDMDLADRLLRLELKLGRHFLNYQESKTDKPWYRIQADELQQIHLDYFGKLIGTMTIKQRQNVRQACVDAALDMGLTEGIGNAAYRSWCIIRADGHANWVNETSKATRYRHEKVHFAAGLSFADYAAGNVVELKFSGINVSKPVTSWHELRKAA